MSGRPQQRQVIPAGAVSRHATAVIVEPGNGHGGHGGAMTVIPLIDGERIEGFEVRCQCGASVIVECVYDSPGGRP